MSSLNDKPLKIESVKNLHYMETKNTKEQTLNGNL